VACGDRGPKPERDLTGGIDWISAPGRPSGGDLNGHAKWAGHILQHRARIWLYRADGGGRGDGHLLRVPFSQHCLKIDNIRLFEEQGCQVHISLVGYRHLWL
jgi:hypothetical protein